MDQGISSMSGGINLELIAPLEASSWENIRPARLLELTFSFFWLFTRVREFYKKNMQDVTQAIEKISVDPQARAKKIVELYF